MSSSWSKLSRIGIVALLLVSMMQVGFASEDDSGDESSVENSQAERIIEIVNRYFIVNEEDEIGSVQEFLYQILLPMGLVILLIFVGLETAGFGSGDNIRIALSVVIGLLAIPTGVYSQLGAKFVCEGGLCGFGTIIQNFASIALYLVVGFIIFEIGMKSGSFVGSIIGLIGLIIMFFGIAGLDIPGADKIAIGGGLMTAIMIIVFLGLGWFMFQALTSHGHH